MPSDTPIFKDGKELRVSRRAYDQIWFDRGWRLQPQKNLTDSSSTDGDQTGDEPENQEG